MASAKVEEQGTPVLVLGEAPVSLVMKTAGAGVVNTKDESVFPPSLVSVVPGCGVEACRQLALVWTFPQDLT